MDALRARMLAVGGILGCACGSAEATPEAAVVYLNFEGATLRPADADDASEDVTEVPALVGVHPGYAGAQPCSEVAQRVREHFAAFVLEVVCTRPAAGPYAMVVVSSVDLPGDVEAGVGWRAGPPDCGNANPSNVGVVEVASATEVDAPAVAMAVSHVAGIGFGLDEDHDFPLDLASFDARAEATWVDMCFPLFDAISCPAQNEEVCGTEDLQNSHGVLARVLGER